jgi:ParB family chromosome partitioning protein
VELSFLSAEAQAIVAEQAADFKVDMKKAKQLRDVSDEDGNVDRDTVIRIITDMNEIKPKPKNVKISEEVFGRYFSPDMKKKDIAETVEKALAFYFASMGKEDL